MGDFYVYDDDETNLTSAEIEEMWDNAVPVPLSPTTNVHRRYHGHVLVVVQQGGIKQGFIFEPGIVTLDYKARLDSHPADPREMSMRIVGMGRMAAAFELPGQDQHDRQSEREDQDQQQLAVRQELSPPLAASPAPPHEDRP